MAELFRGSLKHAVEVQGFDVRFMYSKTEPNGKSRDNMFRTGGVVCHVTRDEITASACREDPELALRVALENYTKAVLESLEEQENGEASGDGSDGDREGDGGDTNTSGGGE